MKHDTITQSGNGKDQIGIATTIILPGRIYDTAVVPTRKTCTKKVLPLENWH